MPEIRTQETIHRILTTSRVVAVLGAHPDPKKPAHFVPRYLHQQGYEILPVNPARRDGALWGRTPVATLAELRRPVDVVDVFRRSEHLPSHVADILAMDPLPKVVWFQQGIRNDEVARRLAQAGIDVVQDACMLALHKKLGLQQPGRTTSVSEEDAADFGCGCGAPAGSSNVDFDVGPDEPACAAEAVERPGKG